MDEQLIEWLNQRLTSQDMSMSKLEKLGGIPRGYVSKVLSGERKGGMDFYLKAARALNDVPTMLQIAGFISENETGSLSLLETIRIMRSLSPEEQQEVRDFVDYLTHKREASKGTNLATGEA